MTHTLRVVVFFLPVRVLISALLLWGAFRAVRTRVFGVQLLLTAVGVAWVWLQLRHDLVI